MNVLDLFAGAGGFSKGFHDAGFEPGIMIDFNSYAVETLEANFNHHGGHALQGDLTKLTPKKLDSYLIANDLSNKFDVIVGGPPCQGWSFIGRGKLRSLGQSMLDLHDDSRNTLYLSYFKFVDFYKPKVFVMENVTGMLKYGGENFAEKIAKYFNQKGYNVSWEKVNAKDFGIPQNRERLIFIGVRKDLKITFKFNFLKSQKVALKDAISDLPPIKDGSQEWIRNYKNKATISDYAKQMRLGADQKFIFDHVCKRHNPQDLEAFKFLKAGQKYRELPSHLKRYREDIFSDRYRKLKLNDISGCITAHLSKDQYSHIHPTQARAISVREAARIQSFPDSYYFGGGMTEKFKLIGNAVPPLLAKQIAHALKVQVFNKSKIVINSRKQETLL